MIRKWLNKENNSKCILFFNGWGTDENAVSHIKPGNFDICMFSDYTNSEINTEDFKAYKTVYLVAWSLGVYMASNILNGADLEFDKAIALNGTQKPVDEDMGIHPLIFNATLKTWNEKNRTKFNMRMLGGRKQYSELITRVGTRDIENQKKELSYIQKEVLSNAKAELHYDCVLIGRNDLIFTPTNQLNYWNEKSCIVERKIPHYPFEIFESWTQIIEL